MQRYDDTWKLLDPDRGTFKLEVKKTNRANIECTCLRHNSDEMQVLNIVRVKHYGLIDVAPGNIIYAQGIVYDNRGRFYFDPQLAVFSIAVDRGDVMYMLTVDQKRGRLVQ